jgi:hypothetical protein
MENRARRTELRARRRVSAAVCRAPSLFCWVGGDGRRRSDLGVSGWDVGAVLAVG